MIIQTSKIPDSNEYEITYVSWESFSEKKAGLVIIPEKIRGKRITSIRGDAIAPIRKDVKKVIIAADIKYIPNYAFSGAKKLTEVILSSSVKSIGHSTFADCSSLQDINLDKVQSFGFGTFENAGLKNIVIGPCFRGMGQCCFLNCQNLQSVTWLASDVGIPHLTFCGCKRLASVTFPFEITLLYIDNSAFEDTSLKEVDLSNVTLKEVKWVELAFDKKTAIVLNLGTKKKVVHGRCPLIQPSDYITSDFTSD